jgi:hypothetical protein
LKSVPSLSWQTGFKEELFPAGTIAEEQYDLRQIDADGEPFTLFEGNSTNLNFGWSIPAVSF